jgi:hypothetical protein
MASCLRKTVLFICNLAATIGNTGLLEFIIEYSEQNTFGKLGSVYARR